MDNFKGTPGPWFAVKNPFYFDIKVGNEVAPYNVASVTLNEYTEPPITEEVVEYNAMLIAAAPDLLKSVKEFIDSHKNGCWGPKLYEVRQRAEAAVKKALGSVTADRK